ncbi:MAG: response regulator [Desulfamplus sp.]|nr:response regulator [Desulfamplus sp.]
MAGGIAHLFNNYLYAVSGNLELALEYLPKDSLIHGYLVEAMKAANRCADVSGSMLTYLGQNFVKPELIDISEYCKKNLTNFQSSINSGITIETNFIDRELFIRCNQSQMEKIIKNLITNAVESIDNNKGKIRLSTNTILKSEISRFHIVPFNYNLLADSYVCIEVTDTGRGIPKKDIDKIFDPFFTTNFTGRGLGLAIVLGIVKSWGGMIGVRSKVGHGSSFIVFFPLFVDTSIRQPMNVYKALETKELLTTVLLVEDHDIVRKTTTAMLKKMGFNVIAAADGFEAIEMFKKHKDSVNCLITDLSMPTIDGWGTLAEIRKIKPHIPAILASGYDEAFVMSHDDLEKPQAFLHKPYSMSDLRRVLEKVFS